MSYDLPPKDFTELSQDKASVKVASLPIENSLYYVGMNVTNPPFDNVKIRQAVAYAMPYDKILTTPSTAVASSCTAHVEHRQDSNMAAPDGYKTDMAKAKQLMTEAGYASGFETTLSFDLGGATVSEPMAMLMQESLAQIGIKATINKIPGANWRGALLKKDMPMMINRFGGWLNYPEYFFFWTYHGQNAVFNTMSYQNPAMDKLIDAARFEANKDNYEQLARTFISMAFEDVPRIPLFQPTMDVAMQKYIFGYQYWFHLPPDYRQIVQGQVAG